MKGLLSIKDLSEGEIAMINWGMDQALTNARLYLVKAEKKKMSKERIENCKRNISFLEVILEKIENPVEQK